jgi:eukaryotic-like serine/threonine-protein kinase
MSLSSGSRLGPFEITGALGAGGMGEVYRARDTKLNRDVAIKVLPDSFARDPDRLARFKREAQVLASLAHPNIAAIFGLDEVDDRQFLVLELVEGETLDKRIARGPIPVDEAIAIARQIADALEAAHEHGVVHRDLKPANVAISAGDRIKVLDFGLAKALVGEGSAEHAALMTNSPTLTSPIGMTGVGVLLGTAPYMSPEQARGKAVDKRADIWAFGCVLYGMLAGRRAFGGEDVSITLAEVIRGEVDWTALPAQTPPGIRSILERCFQKDVRQRFRDIGDVRLALDGAFDSAAARQPSDGEGSRWRRALPWVAAPILSALSAGTVWLLTVMTPRTLPITRFPITPGAQLTDLTVSPDGKSVAYVAGQLFVRRMDRVDVVGFPELGGTILTPFFSPDGAWIGYFTSGSLWRVSVFGGPSSLITDLEGASRGATWGPDGTIVLATAARSGLLRVSADGGTPSVLTTPDPTQNEVDHVLPRFLPDGKTVLFTIQVAGSPAGNQVAAVDLATGARKILVRGASLLSSSVLQL